MSSKRYKSKDDEILFHVLAFLAILIYFYGQKLEQSMARHDYVLKPGLTLTIWSPARQLNQRNQHLLPIIVTNVNNKIISDMIKNCDSIVIVVNDVYQVFNRYKMVDGNQDMVSNWIKENAINFNGDRNNVKIYK